MSVPELHAYISFSTSPFATPVWDDITPWVNDYHKTCGRSHALDQMEAGRATLTLDNRDRRFDPSNPASPYFPGVKSMRRLKVEVVHNTITYPRFHGFVDQWPQEFTVGDQWTPVGATDGFKILSLARLALPFTPYTDRAMTTDEIVDWVLDHVTWPAADRNLYAGAFFALLSADIDTIPLSILQDMAHAEFGAFFIAAGGNATLVSHNALFAAPYSTSNATFGNTETVGELTYKAARLINDEQHLFNQVIVSPTGLPTSQTAPLFRSDLKDQTSINDFMTRQLVDSAPLLSMQDASRLGFALLQQYKDEHVYIAELAEEWTGDDAVMVQLLARDLMDRITVNHQPMGPGTAISGQYHIEHIDEHFVGEGDGLGTWETTWGLMPARVGSTMAAGPPPTNATVALHEVLYLSELFARTPP